MGHHSPCICGSLLSDDAKRIEKKKERQKKKRRSFAESEKTMNNAQKRVKSKESTIANNTETHPLQAEDGSFSSPSPKTITGSLTELPLIDGVERSDEYRKLGVLITHEGGDYPLVQSFEDAKYVFLLETSKLWSIAGPIAFNILCNYAINSFTNIFVGHIGDVELSAVAIALSVVANFSFGFLLGMGSALERLCGQAYGAGQIHLLGVYMQRSWIILLGACFCLLPLYVYATRILKLLGLESDIAELTGKFTLQVVPKMFSLAINFPTQKFLQAQNKVGVLASIGFAALIVHILKLFVFIRVFKWGVAGAALAYVVGWCKDGWKGLSWLAFKDIWDFVRLSIASAVMLCLEIWYFMIIIFLTGHLDDPVIANINGWEGMLFIGINAAISVRVSNELGSGHPKATKYSVVVTCIESLIIGVISAIIILVTKDYFAIIFTDSEEMRRAVSKLAYLLFFTMILNSIQPVISGVAVGGGWQGLVAYINLFCYYIVGLPLGFVLGYKTRLHGIWLGMIFGTFLQTLILVYIIYKTNWNKEVEEASERMKRWVGGDDPFPTTAPSSSTNDIT
ncbi:hypothetical protein K2173_001781 [Erythroxylum novogranatense]|uniref:Protein DETOXIFICATION n=1 Tax=Erythroxylum novogranatense TaxID=1862640 RepID=A0AAV8SIK8_9ROSI|nr:hypothetical protein K2173_001781 [Erythroxylum novogranatense]